jgi:propionate CoA-transferase
MTALTLWDKAQLLGMVARAGLAWLRRDTRFPSPVPDNPKFLTPRAAASLIDDGDVVAVSGLAGNQRASILFHAIREDFETTGRPGNLTVINVGGHGGRGLAPGTLEELGRPGLCTRLITSHFDTFTAMLDLAAAGKCELQCVPLGTLALALEALGRGEESLRTTTGIGTFIDPRSGTGSPVCGTATEQLVTADGDYLRYRLPPVDVAIFNAPAADRHGNIYVRGCSTIGETREVARAARRNGGRVIANVGLLVDEGYAEVFLPADEVDAVVYYPDAEQAALIPHRDPWRVFTPESDVPIDHGLERVRFLSSLARITPRRCAADLAVARLAATTLLAHVERGAHVNIGVGLGEEVCREVYEAGHLGDVTFLVESGPVGGLPAPGIYFGAALCPERIVPTAEMFRMTYERLDATCLGALQVDSAGNVNVSRRGDGPRGYVGPGGFIDLTTAAKTIVFVSAWMDRGKVELRDGALRIVEPGRPKFVEQVDEVTFNGARALAAGKQVFYATHVGLFRLTGKGMELVRVMPGIDIRRDILDRTPMRVVVPESGPLPVVERSIVTGVGFDPRLGGGRR